MKLFKVMLVALLIGNHAWADDWNISIEKLSSKDVQHLISDSPLATPDSYRNINVSYKNLKYNYFLHTYGKPTSVKYKKILNCDKDIFPILMLQTDYSYEKASLSVTLIKNRLYIFDKSLNLIKSFESTYSSEEDDRSFRLKKQHIFTLDNVEQYACDYIKTLGS